MRSARIALLALVCALLVVPAQAGAAGLPGAQIAANEFVPSASYEGMQTLHYEFGPVDIEPGQNIIDTQLNTLKPDVPGYITRFAPNLVYTSDGSVPRVDVIHLHHGVWLIDGYPTFAAGEEKTTMIAPQGYGFRYEPSQVWLMNHMIHNLRPDATSVKITYDIDFVPDTAPGAADITAVEPLWMDVSGLKPYPVFDAMRRANEKRFTFPEDARGPQREDIGPAHSYTAPRDITLVGTAGHLHPGGLYNDLDITRGDTTKRIFRSRAKYFEPAGAVSWDVSMTHTPPEWRVAVHEGDTLSTSTTYNTAKASWYESMGIMVVWVAQGIRPEAKDPFVEKVSDQGLLTHGHLAENDNHGGDPFGLPDPLSLRSGARVGNVNISDYIYRRGDLSLLGKKGRPPTVRRGGRLRFTNLDATTAMSPRQSAYHTITACKAPCNRSTGIAYPVANAEPRVNFDSGQLGYGPEFGPLKLTPAAQRNTWRTPKSLPKGTYAYFCRVHPFMRGSFRVVKK